MPLARSVPLWKHVKYAVRTDRQTDKQTDAFRYSWIRRVYPKIR